MLFMTIPGTILLLSLSIIVRGDNGSQYWPDGELESGTIKWLVKRVVALESQGTQLLKRLDSQEQQLQSQSQVIQKQETILLLQVREAEQLRRLVRALNNTIQDQGLDIKRLKTFERLLQKSNVIHRNPISSFSNYRKSRIQSEEAVDDSKNGAHLLTSKVKHSQNELPGIRRSEVQRTELLKRLDRQEEQMQSQSLVLKKQEKLLLQQANEAEELRLLVRMLNHTLHDQGLDITRLKTSNRLLRKSNVIHNNPISNYSNYRKSRIQSEGTVTGSKNKTTLLTNNVKQAKRLQNELPGIRRSEVQQTKRIVVDNTGPVAFHAVIDKREVPHLSINQNIVFDIVLENLGGAYHNQHGVFIAPTDGVYIFSVSIMSFANPHPEAQVLLKKDGVVLASVFTHGDNNREDQGSVTIVTKLNQGNEVWASLKHPDDTSIYGGRFSSFMGCLINYV